jgi:hypothetical protein
MKGFLVSLILFCMITDNFQSVNFKSKTLSLNGFFPILKSEFMFRNQDIFRICREDFLLIVYQY